MSKTKQRAFIGLVAVVGLAAAALLAVLGLPYGKSNPEAFAHAYTHPVTGQVMHLEMDAVKDHDTGDPTDWCDPVDLTATVAVGSTHQVAVCLDDYTPNDLEAFVLSINNDQDLNFAPDPQGSEEPKNGGTGADCVTVGCLDDNPDANDGDSPAGLKLGSNWDCTGLGFVRPRSEVLPINLTCNANIEEPDLDLSHDMGLLAVITFRADAVGTDTLTFASDTTIGNATAQDGSCGDVPTDLIGCFGATITKVADLSIVKTVDTAPVVAPGTVQFNLALADNTGGPTGALVFDDISNNVVYNDAATDAANGGNVCDPVVAAAPAPVPGGDSGLMPEVVCGDVAGLWAAAPTDPVAAPANIKIVADVPVDQAGKGGFNAALLLPPDPNMANNVAFVQFAVAPAAMTITDVGSPAVNSVGDVISWDVEATSTGLSSASDVVITKTVDANQAINYCFALVVPPPPDMVWPCACTISLPADECTCDCSGMPIAPGGVIGMAVDADVVDSVGNECTNEAEVCWADPLCAQPVPPIASVVCLPPTVRMEKDIDEDATSIDNDVNLFIKKDGAGGFVPLIIYELVSNPGNDPDGVGAYEFQLKFDHKIFDIEIADTSWLSNGDGNPPSVIPPYVPRSVDCSWTIITENDIRWACVSSGMTPGQLDAGVAAIITVYPEPDMYLRLTPGQENGVFRMLLDENCELADVLGDPLKIVNPDGSESLAPGVQPGGTLEVCSDMGITVRILEGDLDLDCVVGLLDEQAIAFRYGAVFGTLYYDPWYDLEPWNKDYDIDIKDLQKVWGRQGSECGLNGEGTIPPQPPLPVPDP